MAAVAEIDPRYIDDPNGYVRPEAIRGAWVVDGLGKLTGEYQQNPRHGIPEQQPVGEDGADPVQQQVELVATWLAEAEESGAKLSGAEVARRLEVSPKTGQRRVIAAAEYLAEIRQQSSRAHLRPVRG